MLILDGRFYSLVPIVTKENTEQEVSQTHLTKAAEKKNFSYGFGSLIEGFSFPPFFYFSGSADTF